MIAPKIIQIKGIASDKIFKRDMKEDFDFTWDTIAFNLEQIIRQENNVAKIIVA